MRVGGGMCALSTGLGFYRPWQNLGAIVGQVISQLVSELNHSVFLSPGLHCIYPMGCGKWLQ